jgi:hypothetical protein
MRKLPPWPESLSNLLQVIATHPQGNAMVRSLADRPRAHEIGGLVEKAGLLQLDANALYGALLSSAPAPLRKKQVDPGSEILAGVGPCPTPFDNYFSLSGSKASCTSRLSA